MRVGKHTLQTASVRRPHKLRIILLPCGLESSLTSLLVLSISKPCALKWVRKAEEADMKLSPLPAEAEWSEYRLTCECAQRAEAPQTACAASCLKIKNAADNGGIQLSGDYLLSFAVLLFSQRWLAMPQLVLQADWQEVWHSPQPPLAALSQRLRVFRVTICFIMESSLWFSTIIYHRSGHKSSCRRA